MKKRLFISFLLITQFTFGQFANLKSKLGKSLIHSSIAKSKSSSNFYVVASTIKDGNNYDINVAKVNANGVTIWEREIDLKKDDRVLDVVVDNMDNIFISGYTGTGHVKRLYIAKLNSSGVIQNDFILQSLNNTIGTKISISKNSKELFVGGLSYNKAKFYDVKSQALLISVSTDLKKLNWEAEYSLSSINNTITDIVELPNNNLFITGSLGKNITGQVILAAFVNSNNGNVIKNGNLSFGVSQDFCLGASAVYDPVLDQIWLLFNAGSIGKPYFIGIVNATGIEPALKPSGYVIDINNTPTDKYAAYKIMLSPSSPGGLTIFGYKDQTALYGSGFGLWALDLDRNTAKINGGLKLWNPSGATIGLEAQGGDMLSLFSKSLRTGMPYLHTPKIAVESHDASKFVALTLDDVSGNTEVGVLSFNNNLLFANSACLKFLDPLRRPFTVFSKGIFKRSNTHGFSSSKIMSTYASPSNQSYCTIHAIQPKNRTSNSNSNVSELEKGSNEFKLAVYPNPTSGVLNISFEGENAISDVKLINNLGQVVLLESIFEIKSSITINIEGLKKGVYVLIATNTDGETKSERIVKL